MHTDVDAADKMLVRLCELLRITMSHTGAPQTSLREEVAFIERYLDIEKIRFRNRLEVAVIVGPEAIDAQVPSLILQPMVENAMHHGIEPNSKTGRIEAPRGTKTARHSSSPSATTAPGLPEGGFKREGIGVANTRARLAEPSTAPPRNSKLANRPEGGLTRLHHDPLYLRQIMTNLRILVADDEPPGSRTPPRAPAEGRGLRYRR